MHNAKKNLQPLYSLPKVLLPKMPKKKGQWRTANLGAYARKKSKYNDLNHLDPSDENSTVCHKSSLVKDD
jgi:hypothetical protein